MCRRKALRRGNFPTAADLIAAIQRFVDAWNDRCTPFPWTNHPDTIFAKANHPRKRDTETTSNTDHWEALSGSADLQLLGGIPLPDLIGGRPRRSDAQEEPTAEIWTATSTAIGGPPECPAGIDPPN